ncbi:MULTISPECIES: hypothetical protein [unclassified Shinella]|uniref:hypothetical protein n=1 Tax=unclassified Shinella TaxID=2643062 RepID=UPI00234F6B8D|nr:MULTISPECIES: hypothetical protein [unclassified Shinella]MCO5138893.1 hypothetical protein [Shinella sp.]MDC7255732.1 hypothetical protein [Shinella sp. YE25]
MKIAENVYMNGVFMRPRQRVPLRDYALGEVIQHAKIAGGNYPLLLCIASCRDQTMEVVFPSDLNGIINHCVGIRPE